MSVYTSTHMVKKLSMLCRGPPESAVNDHDYVINPCFRPIGHRRGANRTHRHEVGVWELLSCVLDADVVGNAVEAAGRDDECIGFLGRAVILHKHAVHELQRVAPAPHCSGNTGQLTVRNPLPRPADAAAHQRLASDVDIVAAGLHTCAYDRLAVQAELWRRQ